MLFLRRTKAFSLVFSPPSGTFPLARSMEFNKVGVLSATIGLRRQLGRLAVDNQRSKIHPEHFSQHTALIVKVWEDTVKK